MAIIGCVISYPVFFRNIIRARGHNVRGDRISFLHLGEHVRVQANLKDGIALGLTRELGVGHLVGPIAEPTRLFYPTQYVSATMPSANLKGTLNDNGFTASHSLQSRGNGGAIDTYSIDQGDSDPISP